MAMMMYSMPGFLRALRDARARRPDLTAAAWRAAANTTRCGFARLRITPAMVTRWAEFYAFQVVA